MFYPSFCDQYHAPPTQIFDRLLASIGQDTLDSLFWLATEEKRRITERVHTVFYFLAAVVYVCIL